MRRKSFQSSDSDREIQINLTPLIDVVFVVLIAFILIAPLIKLDSISLAPAGQKENKGSLTNESNTINIHVYANNEISLNQQKITIHQLENSLRKIYAANPQACPKLYQDELAAFGTYQRVKNALETVGFEKMDVILAPQ